MCQTPLDATTVHMIKKAGRYDDAALNVPQVMFCHYALRRWRGEVAVTRVRSSNSDGVH